MLDPSHNIWHVDLRRVDVLGDTPLEIDVTANRLTKPTDSHKCSIIKVITYSSFHVKQYGAFRGERLRDPFSSDIRSVFTQRDVDGGERGGPGVNAGIASMYPWLYLMWKSYKASCSPQPHFMGSSITALSLLIVFFLPLQDSPNWCYRMWQGEEH